MLHWHNGWSKSITLVHIHVGVGNNRKWILKTWPNLMYNIPTKGQTQSFSIQLDCGWFPFVTVTGGLVIFIIIFCVLYDIGWEITLKNNIKTGKLSIPHKLFKLLNLWFQITGLIFVLPFVRFCYQFFLVVFFILYSKIKCFFFSCCCWKIKKFLHCCPVQNIYVMKLYEAHGAW